MDDVDFYKILGIEKGASDSEIKSAFRKFSKKYHPDMQHGKSDAEKKAAEEMFKKGQAAYECLSDPEKRKIYDEYGIDGLKGHAQQGGFSGGMPSGLAEFIRRHMHGFGFDPFGDFGEEESENGFSSFGFNFGGKQQKHSPPSIDKPEDGKSFRIRMQISLEDVIFGTEKEFTMEGFEVCPDCHGHKCEEYEECSECHGNGMTSRFQGNTIFQTTCQKCGGLGFTQKNVCKKCNGSGRIEAKRELKVKIPIGVPEGAQLRVRGGGICGLNGGSDGDLYIVLETAPHPIFKRVGDVDLQIDLFVNPLTLVYGGNVSIPTPYEMLSERLFSGMKNGQAFKLNGYGIRRSENERGDLIVKLVFDTIDSVSLDKEADEALRKAIMLLENNKNKDYLIGSRKQIKDLNEKTKLPWILDVSNKK